MNLAPALIQDASSGDQQAFVLLVEPLLPDAFRLAVGMLRSKSDAEDAVQVDKTSSSDSDTLDLRRALYRLPYDQRLAIILRFYLDLSYEEVAQTLRISTKAAKSRTYRALERLRLSPEVLPDE